MSKKIYILDCLRTPIGRPYKSLKDFTASRLGAVVIKEAVRRNKLKPEIIDEVIFGNAVSAGTGQNLSRQSAILAGLPNDIPSYGVNAVCGSGLQAIILAVRSIQAQESSLVIAGATESATHSPEITFQEGAEKHNFESHIYDGLTCFLTGKLMGELAEDMAREHQISREDQDKFALRSHQKSAEAQKTGKFNQETVFIDLPGGKIFDRDEKVRSNVSMEKMTMLPPVFHEEGTLTAGNSCAPCDGACAVVVASEEMVRQNKLAPKAQITGYSHVALAPEDVFKAGIPSIQQALEKSQISIDQIDLFEISEAFAVQAIYIRDKLNIPDERINIWGGDIALGHPLGVAGTRILTTLIHSLIDQKKKRGLACVCFGGGGSISIAVEIL